MKVIIVEDEYPIAMNTELQLKERGYDVLGIASDFNSLMDLFTEEIPDLILMDIHLGEGESGIQIAQRIRKIIQVPVVFLSAFSDEQTVQQALETEPYGYLVKPYKIEDLTIAIQVARKNWINKIAKETHSQEERKDDYIFLQSGTKVVKTKLDDILFLQALDNYTIIQTKTSKIIVSSYLSNLTKKLAYSDLIQTHRSYYVNKNCIDSISGNVVYLGKYEVPISRSTRSEFLDKLQLI